MKWVVLEIQRQRGFLGSYSTTLKHTHNLVVISKKVRSIVSPKFVRSKSKFVLIAATAGADNEITDMVIPQSINESVYYL